MRMDEVKWTDPVGETTVAIADTDPAQRTDPPTASGMTKVGRGNDLYHVPGQDEGVAL